LEFEWDEAKAASNVAKHEVAFAEAAGAFRPVQALQFVDRSMNYEEERFITIGMANGIVYYVAHTERGGTYPLDFSAAGHSGGARGL
jgi:uncharacterized DUF497 family protein